MRAVLNYEAMNTFAPVRNLVVDDVPALRDLLSDCVTGKGCVVDAAGDGVRRRKLLKFVSMVRFFFALNLGCALALLLGGCATTAIEEPLRNPPDVRPGPLLDLLKAGTGQDAVRLLSSSAEQVHVLIASKTLKQVLDITVVPDRVLSQQVVRSDISAAAIDATIDEQGRIHLLIDSEHLVLAGKVWRASTSSFLQDAAVTIERPAFVQGGGPLVWTFTAFGKDIGAAPGRWVWRGGGGGYPAGAFLLFPWHEQTRKAILVAEGAGQAAPQNVIDPESPRDTLVIDAATDAAGHVHFVYAMEDNVDLAGTDSLLGGFLTRGAKNVSYDYGRVQARDLQPASANPPDSPERPHEVRLLRNVTGAHRLDARLQIAVDQATGDVLLGHWWLVKGDHWINVNSTSPFFAHPGPVQVSAAGSDRFHGVAVGNIDHRFAGRSGIEYSMLSNGKWSSPLWLSRAGTLSALGTTVVGMVSTGNGNAFIAWSTDNGSVGRWVYCNP